MKITSLLLNLTASLHIIMLEIRSNRINTLLRPLTVATKPRVIVKPNSDRSKNHGNEPITIVFDRLFTEYESNENN